MKLEELLKGEKVFHFKKGEKIYEQKSYLTDIKVFYIVKGEVVVRKKFTPLVKEEYLYSEGDFFGFLEIYTSKIRITEAEAKTDVDAIGMEKVTFEKILISNKDIAIKVIKNLSYILRLANQKIKNLPH